MKKTIMIIGLFIMIFSLAACKQNEGDDLPVIYVTVYPMQFLVEEIAGNTVEVKRVPGASSHSDSIDWSAKEIISMINSDLLFYVHAGADDYIPNNASVFSDGSVELVDMSQHLTYNLVCYTHTHDDEETHETSTCDEQNLLEDPHFWLDPVLMINAALFVKDKLIATYPENEELYNNKYTVLSSALDKLASDFQQMADLATKPVITTVMLFTYWHARYDIDIESITSDAHSAETNPGDLIELITFANDNNIIYILFEKNANSPSGDQLLADLRQTNPDASALYLHGLGNTTEAEMTAGLTYLSIMYDNLEVLKAATK